MFRVIEDPQFTVDVPVDLPDGDGWNSQMLRTRFRALPISELNAIDEAGGDTVMAFLDRAVVAFEGLVGVDGEQLDGRGEWRARLLEFAYVRSALVRGYYAGQSGARAGNSDPSVAPGRGAN